VTTDAPCSRIMTRSPITVGPNVPRDMVATLMQARQIQHVPRVDAEGFVTGLEILADLVAPPHLDTMVVLMAGGLGTRLRPLTENVPKPMLPVGGRPLLEIIVGNLAAQGFRRFRLAVNYKAEAIERHFGDGSQLGCEIGYLREPKPLGTAGCLSRLGERPTSPFVVMNGDLLTALDFRRMLDFHRSTGARATVALREHAQQVPYGVARSEGDHVLEIVEKPVHKWMVNAGIYVLDPSALDLLDGDRVVGMPELLNTIARDGRVAGYPLKEYWIDIGRHEDLQRAEAELGSLFS
jgi:NDP-sugar pyrophosphorylase family protein